MSFHYAGIGSRNTPKHILEDMTRVAGHLEFCGFTLRSGGAYGADLAFEAGVQDPAHKEIFLPWPGFNGIKDSPYMGATPEARRMAADYHPNWDACSPAAKKFHARNSHQILGWNLNDPVDFVLCWTKFGEMRGGTSQALRIAQDFGVPIFNLFNENWEASFGTFLIQLMDDGWEDES